jgi:hypothetical protein
LPREARNHSDVQGFGVGKEAAVEAAAKEHVHAGGREALEALGPRLVANGQSTNAVDPAFGALGDQELMRRAESGGYVITMKRDCQHRQLLLVSGCAVLVPEEKPFDHKGLRLSRDAGPAIVRRSVSGVRQSDLVCFRVSHRRIRDQILFLDNLGIPP